MTLILNLNRISNNKLEDVKAEQQTLASKIDNMEQNTSL